MCPIADDACAGRIRREEPCAAKIRREEEEVRAMLLSDHRDPRTHRWHAATRRTSGLLDLREKSTTSARRGATAAAHVGEGAPPQLLLGG